jgi:hypothetical protein
MRKLFLIIIVITLGCDNEDAWDCIQTAGRTVEVYYELETFNKIRVNRNVELIVKQGDTQEVRIETGENLLSDVSAVVIDGQLVLSDTNNCNFVRDSGITKAYVTSPNIEELFCSTQFPISSDGVLGFEKLNLVSNNFEDPEVFNVGDFNLEVNCSNISVFSNGLSVFNIRGKTNFLYVGFFAGTCRFEGKALIANTVQVFHDGFNDMVVNPQNEINGQMRGTGDVICHNLPPINTRKSLYTGKVIFVD